MLAAHELGKRGEELAASFLEEKGYIILATNFRAGKKELDIIARDGEVLVIVEVKTRNTGYFGEPEGFVTPAKQKLILRAANAYIKREKFNGETRFDVIALVTGDSGLRINHIRDAFYPTL